jgi:hypothetical protein
MHHLIADWLRRRKELVVARDAAEIAEFTAEVDLVLQRAPTSRGNAVKASDPDDPLPGSEPRRKSWRRRG